MAERNVVIVSDSLMNKINKYRGESSSVDFVTRCINNLITDDGIGDTQDNPNEMKESENTMDGLNKVDIIPEHDNEQPGDTRMDLSDDLTDPQDSPTVSPDDIVSRTEFEYFKSKMANIQEQFMNVFIKYGHILAGESASGEERRELQIELKRLLRV